MQGSCSALFVQGEPYTLSPPMQRMAPPDSLLAVARSALNRQIKIKVTVWPVSEHGSATRLPTAVPPLRGSRLCLGTSAWLTRPCQSTDSSALAYACALSLSPVGSIPCPPFFLALLCTKPTLGHTTYRIQIVLICIVL